MKKWQKQFMKKKNHSFCALLFARSLPAQAQQPKKVPQIDFARQLFPRRPTLSHYASKQRAANNLRLTLEKVRERWQGHGSVERV
jgi:hypothetical protein